MEIENSDTDKGVHNTYVDLIGLLESCSPYFWILATIFFPACFCDQERIGGLAKVVSIQNVYNLLSRQFETGLAEMAIREDAGLLAYSPLAFGILSGKYIGGKMPAGSRMELFTRFSRYDNPQATAATEALWGRYFAFKMPAARSCITNSILFEYCNELARVEGDETATNATLKYWLSRYGPSSP